ncbi:MAG TPA: type II toxin-antitoxin system VapC family toxin [Candidatus Binatia bacterium]|nr:type II toxin-antitoxin system VapC family toxin [Candidatus Binatia bacterium]
MTHLVDANVLSEPTKPVPSRNVVDWLSLHERDLVVDSIVLGELWIGVLGLPPGRKRTRLEQWFAAVVQAIDCIPWDAAIGRRWARLVVDLRRKGSAMPLLDGMIAATALEHNLTVATRNVGDFRKAGVRVVDPFV